MMARFDDCLQIIFQLEGGYSNAPGDSGGATQYGVTQATYSAWRQANGLLDQNVKYITYLEAANIYFGQYWKPTKCDKLPLPVDLVVFDTAVNAGVSRAAKMLQTDIGVTADGVVGPATLTVVITLDAKQLAKRYLDAREAFYREIVEKDSSQQKFLHGWINRVNYLRGIVGN